MSDLFERSPLSVGLDWSIRITSIGLEFALPALIGFGIDRWLGIRPVATIGGAVLGFCVGIIHLLKIASENQSSRRRPPR